MIRTEFPYHRYAGASKERQEVGDPGHCERCLAAGHIAAHPSLGCADVGCEKGHGDVDEQQARAALGDLFTARRRDRGHV